MNQDPKPSRPRLVRRLRGVLASPVLIAGLIVVLIDLLYLWTAFVQWLHGERIVL